MFQQGTSTIAMPSADEGEVNIFFLFAWIHFRQRCGDLFKEVHVCADANDFYNI